MHTSTKACLTSVAIRIRIPIRIRIRIRDPDRHQNFIICSFAHCQPSLKIPCKSVRKFLRRQAEQTDKQRRLHILLGGGNNKCLQYYRTPYHTVYSVCRWTNSDFKSLQTVLLIVFDETVSIFERWPGNVGNIFFSFHLQRELLQSRKDNFIKNCQNLLNYCGLHKHLHLAGWSVYTTLFLVQPSQVDGAG